MEAESAKVGNGENNKENPKRWPKFKRTQHAVAVNEAFLKKEMERWT